MRNLFLIIILFLGLKATSQNNVSIIGNPDSGIHSVWKITVISSHNNQPMANANVELWRKTYRRFQIKTNQEGVAIIIICDITKIGSEILKIYDQKREYVVYEEEISQSDYYSPRNFDKKLLVRNSSGQLYDGNFIKITTTQVAKKVNDFQYHILTKEQERNSGYSRSYAPGFFEFNARLSYAGHNPKDTRRGHNSANRNNYNGSNSSSNKSQLNNTVYEEPRRESVVTSDAKDISFIAKSMECSEAHVVESLGDKDMPILLNRTVDDAGWSQIEDFYKGSSFAMQGLNMSMPKNKASGVFNRLENDIPVGSKIRFMYLVESGKGRYGIMFVVTKNKLRSGQNLGNAYYSIVLCDPNNSKEKDLSSIRVPVKIPKGYYANIIALSKDSRLSLRMVCYVTSR